MNETEEFLNWQAGFSLADDGLAAFKALKAMERIKFELTTREEGYVERITQATE